MANAKQINKAFLTTRVKNNLEIEKAVKRNIKRVIDSEIFEIHKNLLEIFNIKSESDCDYFLLENFKDLIENVRLEKKKKELAKKENVEPLYSHH